MVNCTNCHRPVTEDDARFCPGCGVALPVASSTVEGGGPPVPAAVGPTVAAIAEAVAAAAPGAAAVTVVVHPAPPDHAPSSSASPETSQARLTEVVPPPPANGTATTTSAPPSSDSGPGASGTEVLPPPPSDGTVGVSAPHWSSLPPPPVGGGQPTTPVPPPPPPPPGAAAAAARSTPDAPSPSSEAGAVPSTDPVPAPSFEGSRVYLAGSVALDSPPLVEAPHGAASEPAWRRWRRARAAERRDRSSVPDRRAEHALAALVAVAGAILAVTGTFQTWLEILIGGELGKGGSSTGWNTQDGRTVAVTGVITGAVALALLLGRRDGWLKSVLLVTGAINLIVAVANLVSAGSKAHDIQIQFGIPADQIKARIGLGLWLVMIGGLAQLLAGLLARREE
jgi:hypothetical protein